MDKLKSCPFCGSHALLTTHNAIGILDDNLLYAVICQNEEALCNVKLLNCNTEEEAANQWNTRKGEIE